ncbi:MAG: deoxyribose-phosphate aldolase [Phycisphaerales bacterium]
MSHLTRRSMRSVDPVMLEQRALALSQRSIKAEAKERGLRLAVSMIDLTTLEGADTPEKVRGLCRKAIDPLPGSESLLGECVPSVAAVCVFPSMVTVARDALEGSSVKVASVATGFPSGQYPLDVRLRDTQAAIDAGADEIDMVINRSAFLAGRIDEMCDEIRAVLMQCESSSRDVHLKIILETGELGSYRAIRYAADCAIDAATSASTRLRSQDGGIFIKTSTGKISSAATLPVTLVMLEAIRDHFRATGNRIGIKPAGGIRTAKQALQYLVLVKETLGDAWLQPHLFRIGASSLLNDILRQLMKTRHGSYASIDDFADV